MVSFGNIELRECTIERERDRQTDRKRYIKYSTNE